MKIQFSTPSTWYHVHGVFYLGCVVFAMGYFSVELQQLLGEAEKSILRSRGLNRTKAWGSYYCDLPYDDCRCVVLLNKSNNSEKCITDMQLVGSRILPLVSFVLEIFLFRELFSLSTDRPHVIRSALWIISLLIFIGMIIGIYWNSCYHVYITLTVAITSVVLWLLSFYLLPINLNRIYYPVDNDQIIVDRSKNNNNVRIAWRELP